LNLFNILQAKTCEVNAIPAPFSLA